MIVVTGASGVIGRAFVMRLQAECLPFVVLDREILSGATYLVDLLARKPSVVVHLAASVPKPPVIPDNEENAAITADLDERILEAIKLWECHAIYASGCSLYPKGHPIWKSEDMIYSEHLTQSFYLAAKQRGEQSFMSTGQATVLRISAPIGKGLPESTVLGRFIDAARCDHSLDIWGSGQREQNFVDVIDIADALFRSMIVRPCEVINISADYPITMLDLAKKIVEIFGRGSVHMTNNPDPKDGETARYSNVKAGDILGWRPSISVEDSLESLIRGFL
jgi:nucleoside-diphosphate-sugar epimerase